MNRNVYLETRLLLLIILTLIITLSNPTFKIELYTIFVLYIILDLVVTNGINILVNISHKKSCAKYLDSK